MSEMADKDYDALDLFVRTVLADVAAGKLSVGEATAVIMHPLTAWDKGNQTEFIPWIKIWLKDRKDA